MIDDKETPPNDALEEELIDHLYEVAIDPSRYEALLDQWEALVSPRRAAANADAEPALHLASFETHFRRAEKILSNVLSNSPSDAADPDVLIRKIDLAAGFVVDKCLTVTHVNSAASHALAVTTGAKVSELSLGEGEAEILERRIEQLLFGNSAEPVVVRVRSALAGRLILMHLRLVRPEAAAPFVIALASEMGWPEGFSEMLQNSFDLTPTEAEVTRSLAEGQPLIIIAKNRDRSIETIRAQIKSIMSKTETRSQAELVRLTLSTMEMVHFSGPEAKTVLDPSSPTGRLTDRPYQHIILRDGRRLEYLIFGDPVGRPLLYYPQDYGFTRWPASAEADAAKRGIKVVVMVRPGFNLSTSLPKGTPYCAQITEDTIALLDHLKIARMPTLTLGGDFFLAAMLRDMYPERVSAMICCAGVLPLTRPEQYERMDKWHRFIMAGARYTPHLLPFMVKAGFALAHRLGKRGFLQAVYGKSAADVETFSIPEVFEAMKLGTEVSLSDTHSAHDAFAREIVAQETGDWTEELASLKRAAEQDGFPVHFLNGLQDPQTPPATLSENQRDYPWIDFRVYPDAGQLLFFLKWRDTLAVIERFMPPQGNHS